MITVEVQSDVPDEFFPDEAEGLHFHRAFGRAHVPDFELGCLVARRGAHVVATAPFFVMRFGVGTMLPPGFAKRLLSGVSLRIACLGHPSADTGRIHGETSSETLDAINSALGALAPLVCYKGFGADLPLPGFAKVIGLPVPILRVKPTFWADLGAHKRSDLKRKLKFSSALRFEESDGLTDEHVERVLELYLMTHEKAAVKFERLNKSYFVETASISKYLLFFEGDLLIGFAQTLCGDGRMIHKYVGMDYERSRHYRLYFALFLRAIDICIRDRLQTLDSGVTAYAFKRYLGSEMKPTWLYYRHRNRFINALLRRFAFVLKPSPDELL